MINLAAGIVKKLIPEQKQVMEKNVVNSNLKNIEERNNMSIYITPKEDAKISFSFNCKKCDHFHEVRIPLSDYRIHMFPTTDDYHHPVFITTAEIKCTGCKYSNNIKLYEW